MFFKKFFVAIAVLLISIPLARAQAPQSCEPFTVVGHAKRTMTFIDLGEPGTGPGDERIGKRVIYDASDTEIGVLTWVVKTITNPTEDEAGVGHFSGHFEFPDGSISYLGILRTNYHAHETRAASFDKSQENAILGGTGIFTGAEGTIESAPEADRKRMVYTIDIRCD